MKIEKGMAVNVDGMSDVVREAVVKKFEDLGFARSHLVRTFNYIGINGSTDRIASYKYLVTYGHMAQQITLEQLMFCDQPDDVTNCYFYPDDGYLRYTMVPICTREPAETKDWYEEGELPPIGEIVEYKTSFFSISVKNSGQCKILGYNRDHVWIEINCQEGNDAVINTGVIQFRPIKSERDKLVELAMGQIDYPTATAELAIENLVALGWRPKGGE